MNHVTSRFANTITHISPGLTRQIVLGHDKFFQVDVICESHLARVDAENPSLRLLVGQGKLNFAVNTPRANQRGVEGLNAVRRHDNLDVTTAVKPVELVQQLQHRPLNLSLTPGSGVVAFRSYSTPCMRNVNRFLWAGRVGWEEKETHSSPRT